MTISRSEAGTDAIKEANAAAMSAFTGGEDVKAVVRELGLETEDYWSDSYYHICSATGEPPWATGRRLKWDHVSRQLYDDGVAEKAIELVRRRARRTLLRASVPTRPSRPRARRASRAGGGDALRRGLLAQLHGGRRAGAQGVPPRRVGAIAGQVARRRDA